MLSEYAERSRQVIYDQKWRLLTQRARLFRFIPFIEGALGAGSLAVGNVQASSDLDVLVLARAGRIFTARFFSVLAFSILGWRRSKLDHHISAVDKICLNHFITPAAYRFALPQHEYWRALYQGLTPVYGSEPTIAAFFAANKDWTGTVFWQGDSRHVHQDSATSKRLCERLLSGRLGSWFERVIKKIQVSRIEHGLRHQRDQHRTIIFAAESKGESQELPPLIRYTDTELEFHPEPAVIESR